MEKDILFGDIIPEVNKILQSRKGINDSLKQICNYLEAKISIFDWVGIYFFDKKENQLVLGPFVGKPSPHTVIPMGKGVCGQVCKNKKTLIIQDVSKENNYLSCSPLVKSELVIPILKDEEILGVIDIDSHTAGTFTEVHKEILEQIAKMISKSLPS